MTLAELLVNLLLAFGAFFLTGWLGSMVAGGLATALGVYQVPNEGSK